MLFYTITALTNAATSIVLGLLVYFKNKRAILNKIFAVFCLSVASWASFYFFWLNFGTTKPIALLFGRALNISAIFIAITYFHLITVLLNIYQEKKKLVIFGYLVSFFLFISGFTPLFVRDVEPELSFLWYPKPGITYHIFVLMFFGLVIYSWYLMIKAINKTTGITNIQIKYVLIGTLIGFIGGSTSFFPVYGIPIPPFGNVLVAIYVILISFTILKYHLFGIKVILTEILVGTIGLILFIQAWITEEFWARILNWGVLFLFSISGYYLIKATIEEIRKREQIERMDKELRKTYKELKKLDIAKSEFISIASHQLRTPLTAIKGYVSLIKEKAYGEFPFKMKKSLNNIYSSVERLIKLVNDLLSISRIEAGKIKVEPEKFLLEELIADILEELRNLAKASNLYLKWERTKTSLSKVSMDKAKMRQVILNIIDNAIKYTQTGGVTINYKQVNGLCRIEIKDTGEGMTRAEISNLFKTFSRGIAGRRTWTEGAGLGLYIAKKFTEMHNGRIWVKSAGRKEGSTFYIELPIKYEEKS